MKTVEVVAAIIINGDYIFCAQRNYNDKEYLSYKFEFPGGKIEQGETYEQALLREIREELDWSITIDEFFMSVDYTYPDFKLIMHTYLCSPVNEEFNLNEHASFKWIKPADLKYLNWATADIPIVDKLIKKSL